MKRKLIKTINVDKANFEHIAKTGNINGTLLIEIERVMKEYAKQESAELLAMLIKIGNIENHAFTLKGFDIVKLKKEVNEAIEKVTK